MGTTLYFGQIVGFKECSIGDLAPTIVASVQPRLKNKRIVAQALENNTWMNDIQGV